MVHTHGGGWTTRFCEQELRTKKDHCQFAVYDPVYGPGTGSVCEVLAGLRPSKSGAAN